MAEGPSGRAPHRLSTTNVNYCATEGFRTRRLPVYRRSFDRNHGAMFTERIYIVFQTVVVAAKIFSRYSDSTNGITLCFIKWIRCSLCVIAATASSNHRDHSLLAEQKNCISVAAAIQWLSEEKFLADIVTALSAPQQNVIIVFYLLLQQ